MRPYKGYLIETTQNTTFLPSGFGPGVAGVPSVQWVTRVINTSTGHAHVFNSEKEAEDWVNVMVDPTGLERTRQTIERQISDMEYEITDAKEEMLSLEKKIRNRQLDIQEKQNDLRNLGISHVKKDE